MNGRRRWPLHLVGLACALAAATALSWLVEVAARPLFTDLAMLLRHVAFALFGFGPALAYGWLLGRLYDGPQNGNGPAPVAPARLVILHWVVSLCLLALGLSLAARAFPGPWLSSD